MVTTPSGAKTRSGKVLGLSPKVLLQVENPPRMLPVSVSVDCAYLYCFMLISVKLRRESFHEKSTLLRHTFYIYKKTPLYAFCAQNNVVFL